MNHPWRTMTGVLCGAAMAAASAAPGCGGSNGTGTTTGTGGGGTTSSHGGGTTSASSAASTSSSTGTGGTGTGGGTTVTCLDPSKYPDTFTIMDAAFCAVAVYTANEALPSLVSPSWGTHGGPLVQVADAMGGGVTLERWTPPAGAMGAMVKASTHVAVGVPAGAFLNGQANDLPFFGWTAVSWTGPAPSTAGQIALIAGGASGPTYMVNGVYALAGISDGAGQGRVLYSGQSVLGTATAGMNGLYAADACSMPMQELGAGTGCAPSVLVDAWDEYSGPVALNTNGDAFAVLAKASAGTQEARGYAAAQVKRGAPPVKGTTLFTVKGFSGSLAAFAPTASAAGVVVFQPFDSTSFDALDVIEQTYTVSGGSIVAGSGMPTTLLHVPTGSTSGYPFFTDGMDRLWVAVPGTTSTTYVVIARVPV